MSNSAIFETLTKARTEGTLVALYANPDNPRAFSAGWVEAVTPEHVVLRHVSPEGRYDGYILRYMERVLRVDTNGRYLERLSFLFQARKQEFTGHLLTNVEPEANLLVETLLSAQRLDLLVAVEIAAEDSESGAVKSVSADAAIIDVYDLLGAPDSETTVHLEAISGISVDDEQLQSLKLLSRWHQMEPPSW